MTGASPAAGPDGAEGDGGPRDDATTGETPSQIFLKDRQKGLVALFIEQVLNAHDADALDRFTTPDFTTGTPEPGYAPGREGFRAWLRSLFTGFPDMRWRATLMLYEEQTVVVRVEAHGTHTGEFRGIPPSGRPVEMEAVHIVGLRDGRMATHYRVGDDRSLIEQITPT
jgi:steroid delta-isomerase-like uncharacterized protein